ncbi:MAG: SanA protein [Ruminococcaceae bacterium]|nr:SanA protein [Oscillospiraceae bacterium]
MKKFIKRAVLIFLALCLLGGIGVLGLNAYIKSAVSDRIINIDEAAGESDADCILVLGCLVKPSGPSDMLRDRLNVGVELYEKGAAPKLLMSGDHGREDYNEVEAMKAFAIEEGIASEDVFMDHAGFSTYDSIYRAREIFGADKIIIVTQKYHLYRALYIARSLGVEAYGVPSDFHTYGGQWMREVREMLARCKDFGYTLIKPLPVYLGEEIPINGNGDLTNDGKEDW